MQKEKDGAALAELSEQDRLELFARIKGVEDDQQAARDAAKAAKASAAANAANASAAAKAADPAAAGAGDGD
jgi:hypothetical protein